ncbi:MAG: hypothetical protein ACLQVY_00550, partial [Limisphaerales bacterium]
RVSEVTALKVGDIDSKRMLLRVEQGKGAKDRFALLPPLLLERLRTWWRFARAQGKVLRHRLALFLSNERPEQKRRGFGKKVPRVSSIPFRGNPG